MAPKKTGGNPGEKVPGISFRSAAKFHKSPFQLRLYHGGKESYSYHATFDDALKAKKQADRLKQREGSRALGYDRAAQLEYEESKRLIGPDSSLVDVARKAAARSASGHVTKTVEDAVEAYLAAKKSLKRSPKHIQDIRQRLTRFSVAFPRRDLDSISRADVMEFLHGLGLKARTVWNFYGLITALFHHAIRADWCEKNPCEKIDLNADMPEKHKGRVEVLTSAQGKAVMREIEAHEPLYIGWACIQYFLGVRDAESERFQGEWVQRKARRIVIPGWNLDGELEEPVAKTRDDWVIDKAPPAFWAWVDGYPEAFSRGPMPYPSFRAWGRVRRTLIANGHFNRWPLNGFRHSFCTYHLSWMRDAQATSFILRHRSPQKLWDSYFAKFVSRAEGKRYLSLQPT